MDEMDSKLASELDANALQQGVDERPRKPGTFVKGDPRINRTDGPASKYKPRRALRDMRAVYGQEESEDRGPAQKQLRKMFQENTDKFLARMERLEQAHEARELKRDNAASREEPIEVDEGSDRAEAEIKELLAKCREGIE